MNDQNAQNPQNSNQTAEPVPVRFDDNVWYSARGVKIEMGESGTGKDQIILHLEVDPGDGKGKWAQVQKHNDISTPAGEEITMGDIRAMNCRGFLVDQWIETVDQAARFSVIFKTTQYQGKWTQKIDRINVNTRKPPYTADVVRQKAASLEARFRAADARRLEYQQNKALGQSQGGGNNGRSNELPQDRSERDEFSTPGANGAKRDRF